LRSHPANTLTGRALSAADRRQQLRVERIEDAEVLKIDYARVEALYFQNPSFGFYFLRLASARLFRNIASVEALVEEREREILRLQVATPATP